MSVLVDSRNHMFYLLPLDKQNRQWKKKPEPEEMFQKQLLTDFY